MVCDGGDAVCWHLSAFLRLWKPGSGSVVQPPACLDITSQLCKLGPGVGVCQEGSTGSVCSISLGAGAGVTRPTHSRCGKVWSMLLLNSDTRLRVSETRKFLFLSCMFFEVLSEKFCRDFLAPSLLVMDLLDHRISVTSEVTFCWTLLGP